VELLEKSLLFDKLFLSELFAEHCLLLFWLDVRFCDMMAYIVDLFNAY